MKKVFMIHGFMGQPNGGWRPWLMGKLAEKGVYACALPMPSPNDPKVGEWVAEISRAIGLPGKNIFLVGHSLGVAAILRYLENLHDGQKIGGAVLVAGPCHILEEDNPNSKIRKVDNFVDRPFNFKHIKEVCDKFTIIHGDNDTKVPIQHANLISTELGCDLITIPNGGHLNEMSGYYELPEALTALDKMLQ